MLNGSHKGLEAIPRKPIKRRRNPLATLPGILAEMSKTYKAMKLGKLDEETARARVWVLDQMRCAVADMELGQIEAQLAQLATAAEARGLNGHTINDRPLITVH